MFKPSANVRHFVEDIVGNELEDRGLPFIYSRRFGDIRKCISTWKIGNDPQDLILEVVMINSGGFISPIRTHVVAAYYSNERWTKAGEYSFDVIPVLPDKKWVKIESSKIDLQLGKNLSNWIKKALLPKTNDSPSH